MAEHKTSVAILASGDREGGGGGSTMARFIEGAASGEVDAEVGLVVCNNPRGTVGVYDHVDRLNNKFGLDIEVITINGVTHPGGRNERGQTDEEAEAIYDEIVARGIFFVLQLGYMKQTNGKLIEELGWHPRYAQEDTIYGGKYLGRIVNTHPGILPATADTHGLGASERVKQLGLEYTAHTLHLVSSEIDNGPTIAEHLVPIAPSDTPEMIFDNVQAEEKASICGAMDRYFKEQRAFLDRGI